MQERSESTLEHIEVVE